METSHPPKPDCIEAGVEGDMIIIRVRGEYDMAVERYLQSFRAPISNRYGYRLVLIDTTEAGSVTPEARREMVRWNREQKQPGAVAILGASFAVRTLAKMVLVAIRALTKRKLDFDFFDSEVEARAWLEKRREYIRRLIADEGP